VKTIKRKMLQKLIVWKDRHNRKPLILHGARQVGKTWLIHEFGKAHFDDVIYINFETNVRFAKEFDADISPAFLLNRMELFFEKHIISGKTLIVFDEVQVCERALTSLKYFCEDAPEYHVVAAGSLLGVSLNRERYSFPVGKVELLTLFPLDFEEFLWASEREQLAAAIRKAYEENQPMGGGLHQLALELYRTYLVVGGMPAAILEYGKDFRMFAARDVQNLILSTYVADMAKYATPLESTRTLACFNSIPAQLAKDNRKFQYKVVQKGGSTSLFGVSLDWLSTAGLLLKCNKITQGLMPPAIYQDLASFKVYMSDVGLLVMKSGMVPHDVVGDSNNPFLGAITENYVAAALHANGYALFYWESDSIAEVDFVIAHDDKVIPVEVKANEHVRSRSLSVYAQKYKPQYAIRISAKNFGFENGIRAIPLYAVFCLDSAHPEPEAFVTES
jgi:hypothetical protein